MITLIWSLTAGLGLPGNVAGELLPVDGGVAPVTAHTVIESNRQPGDETKQAILKMARQTLRKQFSPEEYRFKLAARWIPGSLLRLDPKHITAVELDGALEQYTNFRVVCRPRNIRQTEQVQLAVEMERKLPVTSRRITSGEVIAREDLHVQWTRISKNSGTLISDMSRIEGKTLRRTLLAGRPVQQVDIGTEYLVKAGDMVILLFEKRGIRVRLTGKARQNGARNDEIRIYSEETRKKYLGKVIRPGVAIWKQTL
ncbi:flagellar basal body P-ring formation chaperone FlgA [Aliifodinibius sp. S!AR15-10]|uniref:flagellar basal body P-ring formation chaperone FlgA n=1 Tax=Aliifodinibius sp. S!AR15-10 TaxID=2950437 RepID=UPI002864D775|nr:flagellar basal body P-ring formation chaperone FlgA [Aliifodinibius sp. S!AR15-10]MDR8394232.1 flagellar basal body P-ring formation chaperone FlgA [Aliifodinibius sp. S!AR15-10]